MHGTFFYIGLGAGLAVACGLRPFLPVLLAGALGSAEALGVGFGAHGQFAFLQADWWLLVVVVAFALSYALQILLKLAPVAPPRAAGADPLAAAIAGVAYGTGALLFAGTLSEHGDAFWPGLIGGLLLVALAQRASVPVILRRAQAPARRRRARSADVVSRRGRVAAGRARRAAAPARLCRDRAARMVHLARARPRRGKVRRASHPAPLMAHRR